MESEGAGQFPLDNCSPDNYPQLIALGTITPSQVPPHVNHPPNNDPPDNYLLRQLPPEQLTPVLIPFPVNCPLPFNCPPLNKSAK